MVSSTTMTAARKHSKKEMVRKWAAERRR